MEDILQRISDHVANEATAGTLAVLAKHLGCRVRDIDRRLVNLGCRPSSEPIQEEVRAMLQRKLIFHLPRQIAQAKIEQLAPRGMGERDTPLQPVDPFDVMDSGFGLLPDGVTSSRPPPKDKRLR